MYVFDLLWQVVWYIDYAESSCYTILLKVMNISIKRMLICILCAHIQYTIVNGIVLNISGAALLKNVP